MSNNNTTKKVTMSFPLVTVLTLIFLVLKLTGNIDWPWWSWNGFEASVFIAVVWSIYIVGFFVALFAIIALISNNK